MLIAWPKGFLVLNASIFEEAKTKRAAVCQSNEFLNITSEKRGIPIKKMNLARAGVMRGNSSVETHRPLCIFLANLCQINVKLRILEKKNLAKVIAFSGKCLGLWN